MQHKIDNTLPAIRAHNNIAAFVVYELSSRSWSSLALSCAQIFTYNESHIYMYRMMSITLSDLVGNFSQCKPF